MIHVFEVRRALTNFGLNLLKNTLVFLRLGFAGNESA
ncbi:hypothetical protein SAMN04490207_1433 [Pseudomonas gessardii]|nr:hypothetical protein SAMN04490207_1433 [Pseudomonas gessardii]